MVPLRLSESHVHKTPPLVSARACAWRVLAGPGPAPVPSRRKFVCWEDRDHGVLSNRLLDSFPYALALLTVDLRLGLAHVIVIFPGSLFLYTLVLQPFRTLWRPRKLLRGYLLYLYVSTLRTKPTSSTPRAQPRPQPQPVLRCHLD